MKVIKPFFAELAHPCFHTPHEPIVMQTSGHATAHEGDKACRAQLAYPCFHAPHEAIVMEMRSHATAHEGDKACRAQFSPSTTPCALRTHRHGDAQPRHRT
jgi:hypothetical protein